MKRHLCQYSEVNFSLPKDLNPNPNPTIKTLKTPLKKNGKFAIKTTENAEKMTVKTIVKRGKSGLEFVGKKRVLDIEGYEEVMPEGGRQKVLVGGNGVSFRLRRKGGGLGGTPKFGRGGSSDSGDAGGEGKDGSGEDSDFDLRECQSQLEMEIEEDYPFEFDHEHEDGVETSVTSIDFIGDGEQTDLLKRNFEKLQKTATGQPTASNSTPRANP